MDIYTVVQWGGNEKEGEVIEERQGVVAQYNIRLEHNSTHRETGIRKNGLIQETEAKNCITQEHTFTKIILTALATQLIHRRTEKTGNSNQLKSNQQISLLN